MIRMIVCIKQVPMASELPWDVKTGTLKRELAGGMMNTACKHALEAALTLKSLYGGHVAAITMGPPMAEEILREAMAMGADRCLMLSDVAMAGADTHITSFILARAIEIFSPNFDLILTGCHTTDSETAQVGPQLAEELKIPVLTYVDSLELNNRTMKIKRLSDNFLETLEAELPCLVTVNTQHFQPRYVTLSGLQDAFEDQSILMVSASDLALDPEIIGTKGSPTKIIDVYAPRADKENIVLKGAPKKIVDELFERFESRIGGVIKKDLKREG
jgi:electron transfer flavoprotein beta subunit